MSFSFLFLVIIRHGRRVVSKRSISSTNCLEKIESTQKEKTLTIQQSQGGEGKRDETGKSF